MNVDLHCHTNLSDGALSPEQLVDLAAQRGVDMLAITDHDSIACYAQITPSTSNIKIITGIELSTTWRNRGIHIVGLNLDLANSALLQGVNRQSSARTQRAQKIAEKLQGFGFENCLEGAEKYTDGGQLGRPHFARYLVEIGAVTTVQQAFKRYLGAGKAGDIKQQWAGLEEVIAWIRGAGGVAVLAHPTKYNMTRTKLSELLEEFVALGGEGVEVISGSQSPSVTQSMAALCQQFGLLASCGSDFHSPEQPWAALGKVPALPSNCQPVWSRWLEQKH